MKNFIFAALFSLVSMQAIQASQSKILANDSDKTLTIALDSKGTPRINGNSKTYPTIKDFRKDGDYVWFCYKGTYAETRQLLEALVDAANGDGDSWAELVSIRKANSEGVVKVVAKITDESGENRENYFFKACKY